MASKSFGWKVWRYLHWICTLPPTKMKDSKESNQTNDREWSPPARRMWRLGLGQKGIPYSKNLKTKKSQNLWWYTGITKKNITVHHPIFTYSQSWWHFDDLFTKVLWWPCNFRGPRQSQHQQVQDLEFWCSLLTTFTNFFSVKHPDLFQANYSYTKIDLN